MNKSYLQGFSQKCAEAGVDPRVLVKFAIPLSEASPEAGRALEALGAKLMAGAKKVAPEAAERSAPALAEAGPHWTPEELAAGRDEPFHFSREEEDPYLLPREEERTPSMMEEWLDPLNPNGMAIPAMALMATGAGGGGYLVGKHKKKKPFKGLLRR